MPYCLPENLVNEFLKRIKSGELNPAQLLKMSSAERRTYFESFLGELNAREVNRLLESKMILKNQQLGIINWAKQVAGMKPEVRRDIIARVEKMTEILNPENEQAFLEDLVAHRLKATVTMEEAAKISELAGKVTELKDKIPADASNGSPERLSYGAAIDQFQQYLGALKADPKTWRDYATLRGAGEGIVEMSGAAKSFLSTLDNSFFGRQGIKVLYTNPSVWVRNFMKSWKDIGRELAGKDAMSPIKSEVYSRQNALNGNYERMKLDIGLGREEAFPSSLPQRIPLIGRLFKGAESAFNGAAMRMRADLADKIIRQMEEAGVDVKSKESMRSVGEVINSLTGRGKLKSLTPTGQKNVNSLLFSVKFLKSQFDLLLQPFRRDLDPFARKQAATNLLKVMGGIAAVNTIAQMLMPGSTEKDPRSSGFGKIRIGDTFVDTTGGLASVLTLAARLTPTKHNGKWGFWSKNPQTGAWTDLTSGKYGQSTALDIFENFWEGKTAPLASLVRDIWKGSNYEREKVTIQNAIKGLATPLSLQNFERIMKGPDADKWLMFLILDVLGFSTQTQQKIKKKPKPFKGS